MTKYISVGLVFPPPEKIQLIQEVMQNDSNRQIVLQQRSSPVSSINIMLIYASPLPPENIFTLNPSMTVCLKLPSPSGCNQDSPPPPFTLYIISYIVPVTGVTVLQEKEWLDNSFLCQSVVTSL